MARRSFVAGNWKMNKTPAEARALALDLRQRLGNCDRCDLAVCPTFLCLTTVAEALRGSKIAVGAQNLYWVKAGAFTGEVSGPMLVAAGCQYTLAGHSERRQFFGETDDTVNKRVLAALEAKLQVICCVGETKDERLANVTEKVVKRQLEGGLLRPASRTNGGPDHRLRTGVGHRHRLDRHAGSGPGGPRLHPRAGAREVWRADRGRVADSVRRVGESRQRRGTARPARH